MEFETLERAGAVLLVVGALYLRYRPNLNTLRIAILLLVIVLAATPKLLRTSDLLHLWVLVDRSASAQELLGSRVTEWEGLLSGSKPASDRISFIEFGEGAVLRSRSDGRLATVGGEGSRIPLALRFALNQLDPDATNRLLLLSDGFSTEPIDSIREELRAANVALDLRLLSDGAERDLRITELRIPTRPAAGAAFPFDLLIQGPATGEVGYVIERDGTEIGRGTTILEKGRAVVRLADRAPNSGSVLYTARIESPDDAVPSNNQASTMLEVDGPNHTIVLSPFEPDPVVTALRAGGFEVQHLSSGTPLSPPLLRKASAVILNNIPASAVSTDGLKALSPYITVDGGGLIMLGGEESFANGGYFASPIDELLPVSMELREEQRSVATAIALVLDRSGSMSAGVPGGMGNMTKMDLANEGAARTISLLGSRDELTLFAVDSAPHEVIPLQRVHPDQHQLMGLARSVNSTGGGIYVYEGLDAAWKALRGAAAKRKHIILFSDASDSEQPGAYKDLLKEITTADATVTVIGLGTPTDADSELLREIAILGRGRIFFVSNAVDLPAVFEQETVAVARDSFVKDPIGVAGSPLIAELGIGKIIWPSLIDGYNKTYVKKDAITGAFSADAERTPLVSFWARGAGRTASIGFPYGGTFSESTRSWSGYQELLSSLTRWVSRPPTPPGLVVKTIRQGTDLSIELHFNAEWRERVLRGPTRLWSYNQADQEIVETPWATINTSSMRTTIRLKPKEQLRGAIEVGSVRIPWGPVLLPMSAEWELSDERVRELKRVATDSGGRELVDLASVWSSPRALSRFSLVPPLLILLIFLVLTDALLTRLGRKLPSFTIPKLKWRPRTAPTVSAEIPKPSTEPPVQNDPPPTPAPDSPPTDRVKSRFDKARRRGR